jgi:hypothetical protein
MRTPVHILIRNGRSHQIVHPAYRRISPAQLRVPAEIFGQL